MLHAASATLTAVSCLHSRKSTQSPPHDMVGLSVYWLGFRLSWDESERQLSCLAAQHIDSYAMLVD